MPYGCVPKFTKPAKVTQFLEDATNFVLSLDSDQQKKLITYLREFNCRGNTNHSKYDLFWGYFICVKALENVSGAQHRRKAAADTDTITNVSFAPGLLQIFQIIQANINLLEKEGKLKDKAFFVPGERWVYM